MTDRLRLLAATAAFCFIGSSALRAEIAVSANDAKVRLVDGVNTVVSNPRPDTVTLIDLSANPPRKIAEIAVPNSVAGPPLNVAVTADEGLALVSSALKIDPADPAKQIADDRLSVIDLKANPPAVIATVTVGKGAAGVSINKAGDMAIVANRSEGTISVLKIAGKTVTVGPKIALGPANSGPSHVVFSADGKSAFVTRDNDHKVSVLAIKGDVVEYTGRDMHPGQRPYGLDLMAGPMAVVANIGLGFGDQDTVSVIDTAASPPRVVNTITVGQTPEGIKLSPDGKFVAVGVMNGSNKPAASPFYQKAGSLIIYALAGKDLSKVSEAPIGGWCQGIVWSKDAKTILAQCMVEEEITSFSFDGKALMKTGSIKVPGGPAGLRTAE